MSGTRKRYYRNRREVADMPAESLWYLSSQGRMILVDRDQLKMAENDLDNFYRVVLTPEQRKHL